MEWKNNNQRTELLSIAFRLFAAKVQEMLSLQRQYAASYYGTPERRAAAILAKKAEKEVKEMAQELIQTIDLL